MKKILWVVLVVLLVVATGRADDKAANWSLTVSAADTTGAQRDTVYGNSIRIAEIPAGTKYVWFRVDLYDKDTVLANDTVIAFWQWSTDGATWTNFDSLRMDVTSTNDTAVNEATRLSLDSAGAGAYANFIRGGVILDYDLTDADSAIIGNTYRQKTRLWFFPRY